MNKDLDFYIKKYDGFLSKKLCRQTIKELKETNEDNWSTHNFYNRTTDEYVKLSGEKELSVMYGINNNISTTPLIMEKLWHAINEYVRGHLKVHWFDSWAGYSHIRFNKYAGKTQMAQHCDHIDTIFDGTRRGVPILSVLINLNENYSGGDFIVLDKKIDFKTGDVLIFPSNFMYPHRVTEVKRGIRYSAISWVW
jgi:hypothetical protein